MDDQIRYLDNQIRPVLVKVISEMILERPDNQLRFIATSLERSANLRKEDVHTVDTVRESVAGTSEGKPLPVLDNTVNIHSHLEVLSPELRELITPYIVRLSDWAPEHQLEQLAMTLEEAAVAVGS